MSFWWRCLRVIRKNEAHSIQPLICKVDSVFVIVVAIKTHLQRLLPTAYLFFPSYKTICCSSRMSTSVAKSNHNHVLSFFCCWITTQTLPYALSFKAELEERDWRGKKTFADSWNSIAKLKMRRCRKKTYFRFWHHHICKSLHHFFLFLSLSVQNKIQTNIVNYF